MLNFAAKKIKDHLCDFTHHRPAYYAGCYHSHSNMSSRNIILGIESSCDDTSAAVIADGLLLSNVTASQSVHEEYGGVVPELASRAHQLNIVPVIDTALRRAEIEREEISAVAVTRGPGLLGSLLVGTSFAKGLVISRRQAACALIEVNHLQGHIMAHFVEPSPEMVEKGYIRGLTLADLPLRHPDFPFLCLLVSGGNSQLVVVRSPHDMEIVGQTIDDAAGEAFDKCAKVLGLPYPGGPWIDKLAKQGNPAAFHFAKPNIPAYDYSFSGLKTSFLYTIRDMLREQHLDSVEQLLELTPNLKEDLCASIQATVIEVLMTKLRLAAKDLGIKRVAVAGGVSANSGLRQAFVDYGNKYGAEVFIPPFAFTTDNAAMIAEAGYYKFLREDFCPLDAVPYAKTRI